MFWNEFQDLADQNIQVADHMRVDIVLSNPKLALVNVSFEHLLNLTDQLKLCIVPDFPFLGIIFKPNFLDERLNFINMVHFFLC